MFTLYDKAFKIGFALTVFVFIAINIAKYMIVSREHAENLARFKNAPASGFHNGDFLFLGSQLLACCGWACVELRRYRHYQLYYWTYI